MQLLISLPIIKGAIPCAISVAREGVIVPHIQSHGVGGEAFSTEGLRDPQGIIGLQRFTEAACSNLALFIILSVKGITLSWSAHTSKSNFILK